MTEKASGQKFCSGYLPFNIFICDQFFFASNPNANYADDNQLTNPENIFLAHR